MEITRVIGGKPYTFELSEDEMYQAYIEKKSDFGLINIMTYLDNVEEVGGIPSELLRSERFADKVYIQLSQMEDNFTENISAAATMAVEYEIKSNTLEDMVTANTADLIIGRCNNVNYSFMNNSAQLAVILKNQPDSVIRSLRQGMAAETALSSQKVVMQSCISTVEKYKAATYVSRGINEREDYDDYDYGKKLREERENTGYDRFRQEKQRKQEKFQQTEKKEILDLTKKNILNRKR